MKIAYEVRVCTLSNNKAAAPTVTIVMVRSAACHCKLRSNQLRRELLRVPVLSYLKSHLLLLFYQLHKAGAVAGRKLYQLVYALHQGRILRGFHQLRRRDGAVREKVS